MHKVPPFLTPHPPPILIPGRNHLKWGSMYLPPEAIYTAPRSLGEGYSTRQLLDNASFTVEP